MKMFYLLAMFSLILIMQSIRVSAAYRDFIPTTMKQPNGMIIHVFASGDEYYNWLHDITGYTIVQNHSNGYYVYANSQNGEVVASNQVVGEINPETLGIPKWIKISKEKYLLRRQTLFPKIEKPKLKNSNNQVQVKNIETLNNLVIFVRFSDQNEFTEQTSFFGDQFNSTNSVSMHTYYEEVSYNQLVINTSFYPSPSGATVISYRASHPRGYYCVYDANTNPEGYKNDSERWDREHTILMNAVNSVSSQIPPNKDIDNDNDGLVDKVAFMIQGPDVGSGGKLLLPHKSELSSFDVKINGKRVWYYNLLLSSWAYNPRSVSVLNYEMFDTLGAPDLYHYKDKDGNTDGVEPVGKWDLMEDDNNQHMGAYMKAKYGHWLDTNILAKTKGGIYTINKLTMDKIIVINFHN
ncbi:MAG: hypothetical protein NT007_05995 [Candidatus Kapabacteria bacterium]|nr:hypothetical protein [Candidatus Kapabacteria bacterium]